jgi:cobalt-zinc-cadmium efflux system membrane fusion protein
MTKFRKPIFNSRNHLPAFLSVALGITAAAGCGSGANESESKMTSYSSNESKNDTAALFHVPPDQMSHIAVVPVEKTRFSRLLRLTGSVAYNAFKTTPVFSPIGGPVHEILVAPGQTVTARQPLLTVNSPDYSMARSGFIKARDAFLLAQKTYIRAQDLYAHGAIAESDLQQAESAQNQAQADLQSSEDALRVLGLNDPEAVLKNPPKTTAQIPVLAPVAGEVTDRLVGPGQLLMAGATQCFTISDMSTVWVLVNV